MQTKYNEFSYQQQLSSSRPPCPQVLELNGGEEIWLGLRRASSSSPWVWPNGDAALFTKWDTDQPVDGDYDCVAMRTDGKWYNRYCSDDGAMSKVICCFREE